MRSEVANLLIEQKESRLLSMIGYKTNIESDTHSNKEFRKVIYTGKHSQLVLMSLLPNEEIGTETHSENDQFFRFEQGQGTCTIDNTEYEIAPGDAVIIPAGAVHNIVNKSSTEALKFYTIYSPPHHQDGLIRSTKSDASSNGVEFDGKTTE